MEEDHPAKKLSIEINEIFMKREIEFSTIYTVLSVLLCEYAKADGMPKEFLFRGINHTWDMK